MSSDKRYHTNKIVCILDILIETLPCKLLTFKYHELSPTLVLKFYNILRSIKVFKHYTKILSTNSIKEKCQIFSLKGKMFV